MDAIDYLTKYIGWAVGILGALVLARSQFRGSIFDGKKDFRDEMDKLLAIKEQIIKEREAQAEELRLENSLLKETIAELEKKLDGMSRRLDTIEQQRGNDLEQMLKAASRTTLCQNAPTCINRVIPTPNN